MKCKFKSILALAIALMMCVTMLPTAAFAATNAVDKTITTADELVAFADEVSGRNGYTQNNYRNKTIVLGKDIDMTGKTMYPIGTQGKPFQGIFDGQNHKIENLTMSYETTSSIKVGLFGYVTGNGTANKEATYGIVKNLNLVNVNANNSSAESSSNSNESSTGVAVATLSNGLIDNVKTDSDSSASGVYRVGGICGDIRTYGRVKNCINNATVKGSSQYTGGIVGATHELAALSPNVRAAYVTDCQNEGSVEGNAQVGGIIGYCDRSYVTGCTNSGTVKGNASYGVGGIVGADIYNQVRLQTLCPKILSVITECNNSGSVTANAGFAGGILGAIIVAPGDSQPTEYNLESELTDCHNTGVITGPTATCGGVYGSPNTYAHGPASEYVNHLWVKMSNCTSSDGNLSPCEYVIK